MKTSSHIGKWSVIIGIVIVLNLFFNYAISVAYKAPNYNDFCPAEPYRAEPLDQKTADAENQKFAACQKAWNTAHDNYSRNVFVTLVVLGAVTIAVASFLISNAVIASGLALGGVLSFIIASMRYWSAASDFIRLIILAIALALLFWVAARKFRN